MAANPFIVTYLSGLNGLWALCCAAYLFLMLYEKHALKTWMEERSIAILRFFLVFQERCTHLSLIRPPHLLQAPSNLVSLLGALLDACLPKAPRARP